MPSCLGGAFRWLTTCQIFTTCSCWTQRVEICIRVCTYIFVLSFSINPFFLFYRAVCIFLLHYVPLKSIRLLFSIMHSKMQLLITWVGSFLHPKAFKNNNTGNTLCRGSWKPFLDLHRSGSDVCICILNWNLWRRQCLNGKHAPREMSMANLFFLCFPATVERDPALCLPLTPRICSGYGRWDLEWHLIFHFRSMPLLFRQDLGANRSLRKNLYGNALHWQRRAVDTRSHYS